MHGSDEWFGIRATDRIDNDNAGRYVMRTPFLYVETQLDEQFLLAGVAYHHLVSQDGALKIRMKKIDLLNCDAALPSIQLLL